MQVTCKRCGAEILAGDINLDRMMAKCAKCNSVFSIADQVDTEAARGFERLEAPMPKGFTVESVMGELKITRAWFNVAVIVLTFFCVFWNGFMVVWFTIAISQGIWIMAAFGSFHAVIGLVLAYGVLAGYLNKTVIKVGPGSLEVTSGPLPVPGNKRLDPMNLKQLYSKEKVSSGRRSASYTYEVHAVTQDNKDETVVSGLTDSAQALYIEQQIERSLGIKDQPVRGELGR